LLQNYEEVDKGEDENEAENVSDDEDGETAEDKVEVLSWEGKHVVSPSSPENVPGSVENDQSFSKLSEFKANTFKIRTIFKSRSTRLGTRAAHE